MTSLRFHRFGSLGALLLASSWSLPCFAQPKPSAAQPKPPAAQPMPPGAAEEHAATEKQAADLKQKGDDAMNRLQFSDALRFYDDSYALVQNPAILYNRGRALQLLDRLPDALDAYESFRREAPTELKQRVAKLDDVIQELRGKITTLAIRSVPAGAAVLLAGRDTGTTPVDVRVNAGKAVAIELIKEGYHTVERKLDLLGGSSRTLDFPLQSRDTTAVLIVRSPVPGASVHVDGKTISDVPAETYLAPGSYLVAVEHDGFEPAEVSVLLEAGQRKTIDVPLAAEPPISQRWWLWTTVGAVVVAGAAIGIGVALTQETSASTGDIAPGQVAAPLISF